VIKETRVWQALITALLRGWEETLIASSVIGGTVIVKSISVIGNVNADISARPVETWPPPGTEAFVDELSFRPRERR
jgi:hypothetical protein